MQISMSARPGSSLASSRAPVTGGLQRAAAPTSVTRVFATQVPLVAIRSKVTSIAPLPLELRAAGIKRQPQQQVRRVGLTGVRASYNGRSANAIVANNAPQSVPPVVPPPHSNTDRDEYKEDARKFFRTVFFFDNWASHRSTRRYWRHMRFLPTSRIVKGLQAPLLYVLGVSIAVCSYKAAVEAGLLPSLEPAIELRSSLPSTLTSFALSLLLVFRTNASYARWDNARKLWGSLVNRSRDFNRIGATWIPDSRPELQDMLRRWTIAFVRSLMCHLREGEDLKGELSRVLVERELAALMLAEHKPNFCLQVLTQVIKTAQIDQSVYASSSNNGSSRTDVLPMTASFRMDENLTVFEDVLGGCERILRTPIPISYTRHTSRFMIIWLSLLPFCLWDTCKWSTVPISFTVAFLLLGIEEIGVSIEEPFSILPLEFICATIEKNVNEIHHMHGVAPGVARPPISAAALVAAFQEEYGELHQGDEALEWQPDVVEEEVAVSAMD